MGQRHSTDIIVTIDGNDTHASKVTLRDGTLLPVTAAYVAQRAGERPSLTLEFLHGFEVNAQIPIDAYTEDKINQLMT